MSGTLAPLGKIQYFTNAGAPADGYQLFFYEAGTSTKATTYSDADLTTPNANPVVLDSSGRATIFLAPGSYKIVYTTDTDSDPPTSPIWTVDGVEQVPASGSNVDVTGTAGETISEFDVVYLEDGTNGTAGRWYRTSDLAMAQSVTAPVLGVVLEAADAGDTISVRLSGRVSSQGAVTTGSIYYLSDVAGALETPLPDMETDGELGYPFAVADTTSTLLFPLTKPRLWSEDALGTIAFSSGQANVSTSGADTELTSYEISIPANYLAYAGSSLVALGTMAVAANGDAKTVKISIGSSVTKVTLWSSSANVANHVVPFRVVVRRRGATAGVVDSIFYHGVASGNNASPYMVYTSVGTVDWTTNQLLKFYATAATAGSITFEDLAVFAIRTPNAATV